MKITFDTDKQEFETQTFQNEKEWSDYIYGWRKPRTFYNPEPYDQSPISFPCIMIYRAGSIINNPDGNDYFPNFFLYDVQEN